MAVLHPFETMLQQPFANEHLKRSMSIILHKQLNTGIKEEFSVKSNIGLALNRAKNQT